MYIHTYMYIHIYVLCMCIYIYVYIYICILMIMSYSKSSGLKSHHWWVFSSSPGASSIPWPLSSRCCSSPSNDLRWLETCWFPSSLDWFKGKMTGKSHISWENLWFSVEFPLSQPTDIRCWNFPTNSLYRLASERRPESLRRSLRAAGESVAWVRRRGRGTKRFPLRETAA